MRWHGNILERLRYHDHEKPRCELEIHRRRRMVQTGLAAVQSLAFAKLGPFGISRQPRARKPGGWKTRKDVDVDSKIP